MSTYAIPPAAPDHRLAARSLSRSSWRRIRAVLSLAILGSATAIGIVLGVNGATVSPAAAAPAPAVALSDPTAGHAAADGGGAPVQAQHHDGPHHR